MKAGFLRKNGPPSSDQATMTSRFYRHGDILTVLTVIEDPIYLAEPHIISKSFQLSAAPISPIGPPCVSTFEGRPLGESTPHFVPEKNPFVDELTKMFGLPRDVVLGRPETLYPEYRKTIKGEVRRSRAVHSKLRRTACPLAHSSDVYWRDRPGHHGVGDCRSRDGGGSPVVGYDVRAARVRHLRAAGGTPPNAGDVGSVADRHHIAPVSRSARGDSRSVRRARTSSTDRDRDQHVADRREAAGAQDASRARRRASGLSDQRHWRAGAQQGHRGLRERLTRGVIQRVSKVLDAFTRAHYYVGSVWRRARK